MMETFQAWIENPQEYARNWKKNTGGKVMGFPSPGVPAEILVAAPFLPLRIPDVLPPPLHRVLDGVGVPHLVLEPDEDAPLSRSKIRIEAFLESLRPEDLF
jgi:hypothetical protein